MNRRLAALAVAVAAALCVSCGYPAVRVPHVAPRSPAVHRAPLPVRWTVRGDSIMWETGHAGWVGYPGKSLAQMVAAGAFHDPGRGVRWRIVVEAGTNDASTWGGDGWTRADADMWTYAMTVWAGRADCLVVVLPWVTAPMPQSFMDNLAVARAHIRALARGHRNVHLVDMASLPDSDRGPDGVHLALSDGRLFTASAADRGDVRPDALAAFTALVDGGMARCGR